MSMQKKIVKFSGKLLMKISPLSKMNAQNLLIFFLLELGPWQSQVKIILTSHFHVISDLKYVKHIASYTGVKKSFRKKIEADSSYY